MHMAGHGEGDGRWPIISYSSSAREACMQRDAGRVAGRPALWWLVTTPVLARPAASAHPLLTSVFGRACACPSDTTHPILYCTTTTPAVPLLCWSKQKLPCKFLHALPIVWIARLSVSRGHVTICEVILSLIHCFTFTCIGMHVHA
jgi:hypothetical protein